LYRFWVIWRWIISRLSGLEVTQGHWNWYHSKAWVRFLFAFHSNYGCILHYLGDKARYWWKIVIFVARCYAYARPMPSCGVCLSGTFVDHVKTNKHIFKIFSPLGIPTILGFSYQTGWNHPNGGVECRWGRQKTRFWTNIWLHCIQVCSVVNRMSRKVWKTKPWWTAASVERCSRKRTGSALYARDEGRSNPPWS